MEYTKAVTKRVGVVECKANRGWCEPEAERYRLKITSELQSRTADLSGQTRLHRFLAIIQRAGEISTRSKL